MIREATVDDVVNCQELAEKFYHSRNTKGQFNGAYWAKYWYNLIQSGVGKILLRESVDNSIVEAIGYIQHPGHAGQPCVSTMFWFVEEEYYQGLAAGSLLKAFMDGPASNQETRIAILVDDGLPSTAAVLSRYGFFVYESVYLKEGQCQ